MDWEAIAETEAILEPTWALSLSLTAIFLVCVLPLSVSDSVSFASTKLEEWSAISRANFSSASSPLVNGVDKPHLEADAKYSQVKTNQNHPINNESSF